MRISDQFPSKYLSAPDLKNREVVVTMARVEMEEVGEGQKPVLYFEDKDKGLVLNKTNATEISNLYGDDTNDWIGEAITLFAAMVSFQGKTVPAVRVKAPRKAGKAVAKAAPAASAAPDVDEIPF